MPQKTPNFGLWLYAASDTPESFFDFRVNIAGTQAQSNFSIIDTVLKEHADVLTTLQERPTAFVVQATMSLNDYYIASVNNYVTPTTGQMIILSLDENNTGTVSVGINLEPTVSVMKYNIKGEKVNLEANDIIKNKPILCVYDGAVYVAIGIQSYKDIYVEGTSGQLLGISDDNTIGPLETTAPSGKVPVELGKPFGPATLDENGKLLQTANVADKAILAETAEAVKSGSIVTDSFADDAVAPEADHVTNPIVIQLKASDDPTKKVYMYDGSEHIDIIITPESIGVENTAVYIYKMPILATNWKQDSTLSTEDTSVYANKLNCENVTANTVLSDITLDSSDVGNLTAEAAAVMWKYLETADGTITLYANGNKPEADFHLVARELKGTKYEATVPEPTPPEPTTQTIAFTALTQVGGNEASEGVEAATTTGLTLTFSENPTGLTATNIELTGATLGELSQAEDGTYSVTISNITVTNGESVTMTLSDYGNYHFDPASASAVVYVA